MTDVAIEHHVTLWMQDDVPMRMFYAGRRWRVSDIPTRLRESIWSRIETVATNRLWKGAFASSRPCSRLICSPVTERVRNPVILLLKTRL